MTGKAASQSCRYYYDNCVILFEGALQQIKIVELEEKNVSSNASQEIIGRTPASSLYDIIVRLSFDVSTQVTKSSICLDRDFSWTFRDIIAQGIYIPCHKERWIGDSIGPDTNMTLLDELDCSTNRLRHLGHAHVHSQPSPTERRNGQFVLNIRELRRRVQDAHIVQFRKHLALHSGAKGILRWKHGEPMCMRSQ